jgi:hypothetical protein
MNVVIYYLMTRRPSNVTDAFDLNDHSGSCAPVLGEQCAQRVTERFNDNRGSFDGYVLTECENTLQVAQLQGFEDVGGVIRKIPCINV